MIVFQTNIFTVAATYGDSADILAYKDATLSEAYWNETSTASNNPYSYSKVAAEREAWKMHDAQSRWDLVVINPGLVIGPSLSPQSASGSLYMLEGMYGGENKLGVRCSGAPLPYRGRTRRGRGSCSSRKLKKREGSLHHRQRLQR